MKVKASNSFRKGLIRTLDISGTKEWPNISNNSLKDYLALRRDWENVGSSIKDEVREYAGTRK